MGANADMRVKWPKKGQDGQLLKPDEASDWKEIYAKVSSERHSQLKSENEKVKDRMETPVKQV
jgi:hypothetical protein